MPDRYAVIGNPIGQSLSPVIHGQFAAASGRSMDYGRIEAPLGGFAAAADEFWAAGGQGLNVTAPFKRDAFAYAQERSAAATLAGAANALRFDAGAVRADNFDGLGLVRDVTINLGYALRDRRLLVLGAGGAARGILGPLLAARPARVTIANRTAANAAALASQFAPFGHVRGIGLEELGGESFDALFDATSAALRRQQVPLPKAIFSAAGLAYDLSYGKDPTQFLRQATRAGVAIVSDGLGMLVEQAAESFHWWLGVRPESTPVLRSLRARFAGGSPGTSDGERQ